MRRLILLLVICAGSPRAWADGPCASRLAPETRAALAAAAQDEYTYEVLHRDGKTVVLLGERHLKSKESAALGRQVTNRFTHVGLGGYRAQLYWGARLERRLLLLWRKLGKAFTGARQDQPYVHEEVSSINEVEIQALMSERVEAVKEMSILELLSTHKSLLQQREAFVAQGQSRDDRVLRAMLMDKNIELYQDELERRAKGMASPVTAPKQTFRLEEDHRPSLAEQLRSLGLAHPAAFLLPGALTMVMLTVPSLENQAVLWTSWLGSMYLMAQSALDAKFIGAGWYQRLFPIASSVLVPRDRTMAKSIVTLVGRPDIETLLVIVGRLHVPGLARRLERAGFVREPLESRDEATAPRPSGPAAAP